MLTVVGSIAFDSVRTPFGERDRMLGGSAVHCSLAASFFTDVRVVGVVGEDFKDTDSEPMRERSIDTSDVERVPGETFVWRGHYEHDLNVAHTDETRLNVFADFSPKLSAASRESSMLFLGNIQPDLQRDVRSQSKAGLVALDSMNLWIETERDSLLEAIAEIDCVVINDAEIRMLTGEPNLARAAHAVMDMGPRIVVAKQGEYGAALFTSGGFFAIPGYPLEDVRDPTGAGDSFAGGFLGFLDAHVGEGATANQDLLRRAMAYGSVMASFNVEEFGIERVRRLEGEEIDERFRAFKQITHFEVQPIEVRA